MRRNKLCHTRPLHDCSSQVHGYMYAHAEDPPSLTPCRDRSVSRWCPDTICAILAHTQMVQVD
jgi:hypothetical protein